MNIAFRTLKAAFRKAVEWGYIAESPFRFTKQYTIPQLDPLYLTVDEFQLLLHHVKDETHRSLFLFAVMTMMRLSEIAALTWSDVDLKRGVARVRNSERFTVKGRKPRNVPLNKDICLMLQKRQQNIKSEFVFSREGKQLQPKSISRHFKHIVLKVGLNPKYHFHTLRHTGASWMA